MLNTPAMNQLTEPPAVALDLHQAGHMAEAERRYQAILKESPDHADALHYLGVLLHQRGDNERAAQLLDRALSLAPDDTACWSSRGLVAGAIGDLPYSVRCYEQALSIDPAFANTRNNLGIALQKGAARDQLSQPGCALKPHDLTNDIHDFADTADTAALIKQLDLVITVNTSVAHLAGALGKPVWVFLPANDDWRRMLDRDDSPWYSGMRLFKQTTLGDWAEPVARAKAALMGNES
ncbi:Tetratricopeptide repeat-containing protein [Burkholderia sp. D7]|nr:Tetratricopeptide repeat-containing protein [Burkholderia sp. D7]